MGFNFIIRGHENIVKDTGAIVIINHQSAVDLMGMYGKMWKKNIYFNLFCFFVKFK